MPQAPSSWYQVCGLPGWCDSLVYKGNSRVSPRMTAKHAGSAPQYALNDGARLASSLISPHRYQYPKEHVVCKKFLQCSEPHNTPSPGTSARKATSTTSPSGTRPRVRALIFIMLVMSIFYETHLVIVISSLALASTRPIALRVPDGDFHVQAIPVDGRHLTCHLPTNGDMTK